MAGDWIKWTVGLIDKPEIVRMSSALGLMREVVVCRLMKFWEWCDGNVPDCDIRDNDSAFIVMSPDDGDNKAFLDALVSTPKFADSLACVGWIRFRNGRIELPNFGRHNGETAKTRARNARNQQRKREKRTGKPSDATVTKTSPPAGDKTVTRGEERREEDKDPPLTPPPGGEKQKPPKPVAMPVELDTLAFRRAWVDWKSQRAALRVKPYTTAGEQQQLKRLASFGPAIAIASIEQAIAQGWQGLFPERVNPHERTRRGDATHPGPIPTAGSRGPLGISQADIDLANARTIRTGSGVGADERAQAPHPPGEVPHHRDAQPDGAENGACGLFW
jgi:hypothetical protein